MFSFARRALWAGAIVALLAAIGCQGGGKSSGKYSDLDKPKPVDQRK